MPFVYRPVAEIFQISRVGKRKTKEREKKKKTQFLKKWGAMKMETQKCDNGTCRPNGKGIYIHIVSRADRHMFFIIIKNIQPG